MRPGRARRLVGLGRRLLAAAVFVPCFLLIAWRGQHYFVLLVNLILLTGMYEFYSMMAAKGLRPFKVVGVAAAVLLPWAAYVQEGTWANLVLAALVVLALGLELLRREVREPLAHIAVTILGVLYVCWLGSHFVLLRELPRLRQAPYSQGFRFVMLTFLLTWMSDTGAYLVGSLVGRHKLAPRISPGKSVEGSVGGIALAVIAGIVAAHTFARDELTPLLGAGLGASAAVFGQIGDLVESLLKRDAQVKDTSGAIPGHGGVLDRFDSVLFTAPLLYYVLRFFLP